MSTALGPPTTETDRGGGLDSDRRIVRRATSWPRARVAQAAPIAGVLLPLALLTWVAGSTVLTFDGGLNLKVSDSIANGHGFAWDYGGGSVSPYVVQTSGAFVLLGALFIKVFGTGTLALELPSLVFLGLILIAVSYALRPWRTLQIFGPVIFVLATPGLIDFGLGGYGEVAVGFCMVAAFTLLSSVVEGATHALRLCCAASALIGLSLTIKTITVAEIPVLAAGYVMVAATRREIPRPRLLATSSCLALPVVAFEVYRSVQLGSLASWFQYWSDQLHGIHEEASAPTSVRPGMAIAGKGLARIHSLGSQVGVQSTPLILAWTLAPLLILAGAYRWKKCRTTDWLRQPRRTLQVLLAGVVALYLPWFVFVSPVDWLRHLEVGVIAMSVLYLLLLAQGLRLWGARTSEHVWNRSDPSTTIRAAGASLLLVGSALCFVRFAALNGQALISPDHNARDAEASASRYVADRFAQGDTFCGMGNMSAPVISLTAHVPLCDLAGTVACTRPFARMFPSGRVYLIWDNQAARHYPDGPPSDGYVFTKVAQPSEYASIWRVSLKSGSCS